MFERSWRDGFRLVRTPERPYGLRGRSRRWGVLSTGSSCECSIWFPRPFGGRIEGCPGLWGPKQEPAFRRIDCTWSIAKPTRVVRLAHSLRRAEEWPILDCEASLHNPPSQHREIVPAWKKKKENYAIDKNLIIEGWVQLRAKGTHHCLAKDIKIAAIMARGCTRPSAKPINVHEQQCAIDGFRRPAPPILRFLNKHNLINADSC